MKFNVHWSATNEVFTANGARETQGHLTWRGFKVRDQWPAIKNMPVGHSTTIFGKKGNITFSRIG